MYTSIKTRVFSNGIKSEVYYGSLGVRQGECLSPFLFSMYINDLQEYLVSESGGVTIGHIQMLLLLYADDVVVFAKSSSELQQEMDKLFNYCNKWKLKLNTTKSKIVVFRKGNIAPRESWKFGNDDIEAVNSLSYLGVLFSSNGLFTQAQCKLADQANKAVFTLYKRINTFKNLKTSVCIDLFDKFISPILNYSSEVWGFHKAKRNWTSTFKLLQKIASCKKNHPEWFRLWRVG